MIFVGVLWMRSRKARVLLEPSQGIVSGRHKKRGWCCQGKDTDVGHCKISVQTDNHTIQDGTTAAEFGEQIVLKIHSNEGNNNKGSVTLTPPGKSNWNQQLLRTQKEKNKKTKTKSQNVS